MKKAIIPLFVILITTIFISAMPTEADAAIYEDTVRLHILANSDTAKDQELKLKLRDEILAAFGKSLSVFESVDEAKEELSEKISEIKEFADGKIGELGYDYTCEVTLTREWYDTRDYGDYSLPCGYYTSLRVIIGEGEGKNWWCIMFPPLCLDASLSTPKYTEEEEVLISKKYNVKFKLLELISEIAR